MLPDVRLSQTSLSRALWTESHLYDALDRVGYRGHIAPLGEDDHRSRIKEQEIERKYLKYGRYHSCSILEPDWPTIV